MSTPPSLRVVMGTNLRQGIQFVTRKAAVEAAQKIGWSPSDVQDQDIMGFRLWGICDPHMRWLTRSGYDELLAARMGASPARREEDGHGG